MYNVGTYIFSTRECNFIIQMLLLFCKKKIVYLIHFPRQQQNRKIIYSQPETAYICMYCIPIYSQTEPVL